MSKDPLHTPTPWLVSDERECNTEHFATVISHAEGMAGAVIAEFKGGAPFRDGEGMANAQLIAAAPELLAALKELMASGIDPDEAGEEDVKRLGRAWKQATAAVKKAELCLTT